MAFRQKTILYSKHYDNFDTFRNSINSCISELGTRFKNEMQSLMTMNFQLFKKTENLTAWSITQIHTKKIARHTGMDCGIRHKDVISVCHPWLLDSGNPGTTS